MKIPQGVRDIHGVILGFEGYARASLPHCRLPQGERAPSIYIKTGGEMTKRNDEAK